MRDLPEVQFRSDLPLPDGVAALLVCGRSIGVISDDDLHASEQHRDFEYTRTPGYDVYPPGGDGWNENRYSGVAGDERIGPYAYWRRSRTQPRASRRYDRQYHPATFDDLLAAAGMRVPPEYL